MQLVQHYTKLQPFCILSGPTTDTVNFQCSSNYVIALLNASSTRTVIIKVCQPSLRCLQSQPAL